jgi:hypothetical protein
MESVRTHGGFGLEATTIKPSRGSDGQSTPLCACQMYE